MKRLVAPSILAADLNNLSQEIDMLNQSEADWIHVDIMDGVYVPNISFGLPIVEHVSKIATKPLDVHLMMVQPERYIDDFHRAGASNLTIHYEACMHLHKAIESIKNLGMKAGVSLNPHTPVELLEYILPDIDLVLIMTVNPGFGGQTFIPASYDKIRKLRSMIDSKGLNTLIEVDGGVDLSNASDLYNAGVNVLVSGSTVFKAEDPNKAIIKLKEA